MLDIVSHELQDAERRPRRRPQHLASNPRDDVVPRRLHALGEVAQAVAEAVADLALLEGVPRALQGAKPRANNETEDPH